MASGPPGSSVVVKNSRRRGAEPAAGRAACGDSLPRPPCAAVDPVDLRAAHARLLLSAPPFAAAFARRPQPRGILNSGNCCFMNAVLQALIFTPPFAQLAVSAAAEADGRERERERGKEREKEKGKEKEKAARCPTLSAVGRWMRSYWSRGAGRAVPPLRLPAAPLDGSAQEDAHEFLQRLLETAQSELAALERQYDQYDQRDTTGETKGWTFVKGRERHSVREERDANRSLLLDAVFGGALQSHLKGKSKAKDHASVVIERFFSLPVDIRFRADCTIEEALAHSMQTERITDDARAKDLRKTVRFHRLPAVLLLQLRRWAVTAEGELVKIDNTVRLARTLVLPKATCADAALSSKERTYELIAFVAHRGKAAERGHYVTYVVGPGDGNDVTLCNDAHLSQATIEWAAERESVYFLVYQQKR